MLKKISAQLIIRTVKNREETRALALAFAVKANFHSSQFNNFTYKACAEKFGISRATAKKRITTLREMGLLRDNGKHLVFLSLQEVRVGVKNVLLLPYSQLGNKPVNLNEIEKYIRLQGVFIKQSQIEFSVNTIKAKHEVKSARKLGRVRRKEKKLRGWTGKTDLGQSIKTVMRSSGLKRNKAVELLQWGDRNKFLTKEKRISITNVPAIGLQSGEFLYFAKKREGIFNSHGRIYFVSSTILSFLR